MSQDFQKNLKLLSDTLWQIENQNDFENFLSDLLTPQEINEFAQRINLLKMLKQGKTQREIAQELDISVTTVNRGARILNYGTGVSQKIV